MTAIWAVLFVPVVLIAVLFHWLPLWRRSNLWFGVTVPPDFRGTPDAQAILRRYRIEVWLASLAALLLVWIGLRQESTLAVAGGNLLQALGAAVAFTLGWRRTRPFGREPEGTRDASLSSTSEALPGGLAAFLVPYGVLFATAIFLHVNWQHLPVRIPIHWGLAGTPDRWAERTWRSVDGPLIAGIPLLVILHALGYMMMRGSPRARMAETADWTARFRRANLRMIMAMGFTLSLLLSALALNPYLSDSNRLAMPVWLILGVVLVVAAAFLWPIIRISQEPGSSSDGTPDECWKLGQIYYNPDDPALMVEKRFGVGYTVNFGNRASWLLVALLLLVIFVPMLL